ncbi:unnamed protein product [Onchocerca flexuosa]|nr:unnamed protein product [Onchocerca flexuosa]
MSPDYLIFSPVSLSISYSPCECLYVILAGKRV